MQFKLCPGCLELHFLPLHHEINLKGKMTTEPPTRMVVNQDVAGFCDFFAEADWRRNKRRRAANYMEMLRLRSDDDGIDRLHHNYTVIWLVLFASLVSTKQYAGDPIACWMPAEFTDNHELYTDQVCWVSNTYYDSLTDVEIPAEGDKNRTFIRYYQWIPILLWAQAFLFYIPCVFWRMFSRRSGISVRTVMELIFGADVRVYEEGCTCDFCYLILYLHSYLGLRRPPTKGCWFAFKRTVIKRCYFIPSLDHGNYLAVLYLGIKLLYIFNCIGQLFFLNVFLNTDYHLFGIHILQNIFQNKHWRSSIRFPRLTLCDFEIRELGNINKHTVQCVLPINLFNEKIYVFIWFWFVGISILTILNFCLWTVQYLNKGGHVDYVMGHLTTQEKRGHQNEALVYEFTCRYLRADGVFLARLVGKRAGDVIAGELIGGLWDRFRASLDLDDKDDEEEDAEMTWEEMEEYTLPDRVVTDVCDKYHDAIEEIV